MSRQPTSSKEKSTPKSRRLAHDSLQNEILVALSHFRLGVFWANPTGMAFRPADGGTFRPGQRTPALEAVHFGLPGSSDIVGVSQGGYFVGIEVKTGAGALRENQRKWKAAVEGLEGIHIEARSVDQVVGDLTEILTRRIGCFWTALNP